MNKTTVVYRLGKNPISKEAMATCKEWIESRRSGRDFDLQKLLSLFPSEQIPKVELKYDNQVPYIAVSLKGKNKPYRTPRLLDVPTFVLIRLLMCCKGSLSIEKSSGNKQDKLQEYLKVFVRAPKNRERDKLAITVQNLAGKAPEGQDVTQVHQQIEAADGRNSHYDLRRSNLYIPKDRIPGEFTTEGKFSWRDAIRFAFGTYEELSAKMELRLGIKTQEYFEMLQATASELDALPLQIKREQAIQ